MVTTSMLNAITPRILSTASPPTKSASPFQRSRYQRRYDSRQDIEGGAQSQALAQLQQQP